MSQKKVDANKLRKKNLTKEDKKERRDSPSLSRRAGRRSALLRGGPPPRGPTAPSGG